MINITTTVKKEILLEGLNCEHCGIKIEEKVGKLAKVNIATLNFATKTLTIEIEHNENTEEIFNEALNIINKQAPGIMIMEKTISKSVEKDVVLMGLDCAHCASKIEKEIKNIDGIKEVSVDFFSRKMSLTFEDKNKIEEVTNEVIRTIKAIEPELEIHEGTNDLNILGEETCRVCNIPPTEDDKEKERNKKRTKTIRIGLGTILFIVGIILNVNIVIEFLLYFVAYLLIGGDVLIKAGKNIIRGQIFDENFLMSIATIGAFAILEFPEGVAVMLFYQVGAYFQSRAVNKSRKSIKELMSIRPDFANKKVGNDILKVAPEEVNVDDIIIVKPGEKVPLDGTIVEGKSFVDTSALTGESVPREVFLGSEVLGGFINTNGLITVIVTKTYGESTVSKILYLVQNATTRKAQTENFITKFAKYYTPIVVILALLLAIIPPIFIQGEKFDDWLHRALVFLVVSCPCALVISIPLSFFGGIGGASRNGILIKGSNYLEALNNIDTIVFDKTGTLTKGVFNVTKINTVNNFSSDEILKLAAYAEVYSNHPIALSIINAYKNKIDKERISRYDELSGLGIKAIIDNKNIIIGNEKLMQRENITFDRIEVPGSVVYVAIGGKYIGNIVISDEIKADSKEAVLNLRKANVKNIVMLTGDNKTIGELVGKKLGIDTVYSELLPDKKVEILENIIGNVKNKGKVVFVGDGINDAPVLARADIGIAMGGIGSDAAIEASDIILMTDEPNKLVTAIKIAKETRKIVWQNIIFAFGIKLVVLVLGAGGIATMWEAVFADVGVALIAIFNAMRLIAKCKNMK